MCFGANILCWHFICISKNYKMIIKMKAIDNIKERALFVFVWLGIAFVSTAIAFVFIIGFKQVLGI